MAAQQLYRIREVQAEILRAAPSYDIGLVGNPGASAEAIRAAERRVGHALPPSYRAFLARHDGWPRFFEGATLLGTANLGRRLYEELAQATLDATEAADGEPLSFRRRSKPRWIPFGADLQATTFFAFNPEHQDPSGEYEVVAFIGEIGVRRSCFESFLDLVVELCEANLEAVQPAPRSVGLRPAIALSA